jgi:hypothetical protein
MVSDESAIIAAAIMILSLVTFSLMFQAQGRGLPCSAGIIPYTFSKSDGGVAVSGTNVYAAWTCYNYVLFTGSHDGGKTFANTMLVSSTLNTNPKTSVLNDNVSISASGNNVAIMWDTNKTGGISNPVIRTSSDGGNTFGNIVAFNSTSGGINK